jgi:hypothetical protein
MRRSLLPLSLLCCLTACASMAQQVVPALIVEPSAESRVEILRIVHSALNASNVTIAADALTRESVLVIERKPARDASGRRLSGRNYEKPERFQLVKSGSRCVLIHARTNTRYELQDVECVAAPNLQDRWRNRALVRLPREGEDPSSSLRATP